MSVCRTVGVAAAIALVACDNGTPFAPDVPSSWKTFAIEGSVTESFGLPVNVGTRVSGFLRFDPRAPGVFKPGDPAFPRTEAPDSMIYSGVAVALTIGSDSISGNSAEAATIQLLFSPPTFDVFRVDVLTGFPSGRVGGRVMDRLFLALNILPSRWPDSSLPLDAAVFQAGLALPRPGRFCLGACTPPVGDRIHGDITSVRAG